MAQLATPRAAAGSRIVTRNRLERTRGRTTVRNSVRSANERGIFRSENRRLKPGCSNVPGLGFDEVHLAAVCGPGAVNGQLGAFGSPFFFPFFDSGIYLPSAPAEETVAPETQQPEASDAEMYESRRRVRESSPAMETTSTPPRDAEQYVFVRRDGTVFFAVAYSWDDGTLRYVTSDGLKRNIAKNALDLDATQEFNEQRGLSFHSPA